MLPDHRFVNLDKIFWANVRTISEKCGYTNRRSKQVKVHSLEDMTTAMKKLGLSWAHLCGADKNGPTELGAKLVYYFRYRAEILNDYVQPLLMDGERAQRSFEDLKAALNSTLPVPMNKQKGEKAKPLYLTGIVSMLIEANCQGLACDYAPKSLTIFTRNGEPVRKLARRVDGCLPATVDPIAVWEIKEYYYTTTFGSRVADGVYETLLDGMELEELRDNLGVNVQHLLMVDGHYTWWQLGRSYLCRLVDILNMGYVDEILFGYEVFDRMPRIVEEWVHRYNDRSEASGRVL
ncbi:MAG: hypothetical protein M1305_01315 [Candidatus Marsarchaeota archaeon]|nr:hypothetical protein [Candidatus Marsarchaeota archaeon]